MLTLIAIIISYIIGSLSSAIIVCKLAGLPDPRSSGSKNPGATNILRMANKNLAACVLIGDIAKGSIAVVVGRFFGISDFGLSLCLLAAVLGHMYPVFFEFKGGKGVATACGGILALSWVLATLAILLWLGVATFTAYSSLAALCAAAAMPILSLFINKSFFLPLLVITGLIFYAHRENIDRLRRGVESKLGDKRSK